MSVQQDKKSRWLVRWREDGKHRSKLFGAGEAAKAKAIQFDAGIEKQRKHVKFIEASVSLEEIAWEYHNRHQVSDSTLLNDAYKLDRCILPMLGNKPADFLSTKDIDNYVAIRLSTVKRPTVARELRLLKAIYSWAEQQEPPLVLRNPIRHYRLTRLDQREAVMPPTVAEIKRLISHAAAHLQRAIKILWFTGMRPGNELLGIKWQDVDFANDEIRISDVKEVRSQRVRFVPIVAELKGDLLHWHQEDQFRIQERAWVTPIVHYRFQRIASLKRVWKDAKRGARITRSLRLYDLRHAFASNALRAGADLKSVSEILGHSRPDTTLREYQHVVREQHRGAVELIPSLAGKTGDVVQIKNAKERTERT